MKKGQPENGRRSYRELKSCLRITGISVVIILLYACNSSIYAQSVNQLIRKGNKAYQEKNYTDAEAEYQKALSRNKTSDIGLFNLGNSMYAQKRYEDAFKQYEASAKFAKNKDAAADASYNAGNTFMEKKDWQKSIEAYKNTLRINPADNEARYNLAYAQEMLKKNNKNNQQNQNKQNKQNKQNQQNQNQQNQDQQKNNKDNKDQQNQNKQDQQQQDQHPQPQPSRLTKDQAQQLLNALAQEERKLQDKKDKNKKGVPVRVEKDW